MKLSYLDLTTTSPYFNLAAEQYVFDCLPRDRMYFMLWQNDNAIIIGKHQNTLNEINEAFVREKEIKVVRRLSGGGAVYHDLGNLNFTFIADAQNMDELDFRFFCRPVVRALASIGVNAEINGRNDMTINGKKFSGNSQYIKDGRVMHHGTIMFSSDLSIVGQALHVDESKIQAKGIKSVRSRITNVCEYAPEGITLLDFRKILLDSILSENPGEEYKLTKEDVGAIKTLEKERYMTWEWNYGRSPECTLMKKERFPGCGIVEAWIDIKNGVIDGLSFSGDFFSVAEPEILAEKLIGCRPDLEEYQKILDDTDVSQYFSGLNNRQFLKLMTGEE